MITWPLPPDATVDDVVSLFGVLIHEAYGALDVDLGRR